VQKYTDGVEEFEMVRMKKQSEKKRLLLGSMSILSAAALVSVVFGPSIFLNDPELDQVKVIGLRDLWDIIVPDDYKTIKQAVESAVSGDRIYVRSGVYRINSGLFGSHLKIEKPDITIHGEDKENTFLNGRGTKNLVLLDADKINISGFTFRNNGVNGTLLYVRSNSNIIHNNKFLVNNVYDGTEYAIELYRCNNNIISNNFVTGEDRGIYLNGCSDNLFENNTIVDNYVAVSISMGSENNRFVGNLVFDNSIGITVSSSSGDYFFNNSFISNNRNGLSLYSCTASVIKNNVFVDDGLDLWGLEHDHFVHDISGNLVNDKPLYYYYDKNSFDVPTDAGQIIIVYCNDIYVENVKISNTSTAVRIVLSSNIRVIDSDFRFCSNGVFLFYSGNNYINRNNFVKNMRSAYFIHEGIIGSKSNNWRHNYWGSRLFKRVPKVIVGRIHLKRSFRLIKWLKPGIRARNFDLFPARKPF